MNDVCVMRRWLLGAGAALLALPLQAAESTALDAYLQGLTTWSAQFTQQTADERGKLQDSGAGRLIIVRPGKFRWEKSFARDEPPAELMIADGSNLWQLDYDLEQATVKPQGQVLAQSPAMLLAGGSDLRASFTVSADGRRDNHEWVKVQPKAAESDFREALFGFSGRELTRLVIIDKMGMRSTLSFTGVRRNAAVEPALLRFDLPDGVDLIGKPVQP
jgi:outer membrane lipoprotein carrier protein